MDAPDEHRPVCPSDDEDGDHQPQACVRCREGDREAGDRGERDEQQRAGCCRSALGQFAPEEARALALLSRAGALSAPVEVVQQTTVGPTLAAAAISVSIQAAVIGAVLTMLYMVAAYRLLGAVDRCIGRLWAVVAGRARGARGDADAASVAGFVLAVGMAVDANVLVFERAKEEFAGGRAARWPPAYECLDGDRRFQCHHPSGCGVLILYASGGVRGYGVILRWASSCRCSALWSSPAFSRTCC